VHQSTSVINEEQELLALIFLFRPTEKNRLLKEVLLEKEGQKQTDLQKSTIEEEKESFQWIIQNKRSQRF
jgi:hypothetical protein